MTGWIPGTDDVIRRAAAGWVAAIRDPEATVDRAAFERWRSADPRHGPAFARAERAWGRAGLLAQSGYAAAPRRLARPWWRGPPLRAAAAVAAMVAIVTIGGVLMVRQPWRSVPRVELAAFASRVGEIRKVVLADGSIVTLDTDSAVQLQPGAAGPMVVLVRGRARFELPAVVARPVTVVAGAASIAARGAAFDIALFDGKASVALLRGTADIRRTQTFGRTTPLSRLVAGQQLTIARNDTSAAIRAIPSGIEQWTGGMLSFDRTPLGDAVAAANRYSIAKIVIADPALADLRVSGAYRTGDVPGLARSLAVSLGLRTVRTPRGDIVIFASRSAS